MDLKKITIKEAASSIGRGDLSPVELVEAHLKRIQDLDPTLHTFITLTPELAIEQARQAETEIHRGQARGPLHGIPLALKDLYETAGTRTTAGSKFFHDHIPASDATVVRALRQAGAVFLGKLNLHEIALGVTNENPHFGVCRNPWDLDRIPGGSSGGSGSALAAGLCMGSLGSDTGGSIRIPSSLCGVVGLKPTFGRVSLRGVIPLSWHLDHAGPMARCVYDAALLLQAIAGYDPEDPFSQNVAVDDYLSGIEDGVKGWRIALANGPYFRDIQEGIWEAIAAAADAFTDLGAQVAEVDIPGLGDVAQATTSLLLADASTFHRDRLTHHPEGFGEDVLDRLGRGAGTSLADYIQARRTQADFRRQMERFFSSFDLLLLPTTAITAPPIRQGEASQRARVLTRFTSAFNLTGLPALSLPCGFLKSDGSMLPVGLQLVARPWAEASLLRGAFAYEQISGWHTVHPPLD